MNESYKMEGDYGHRKSPRKREIGKDRNDSCRPHSSLKASELNYLMRSWRPGPYQHDLWES